MELALFGIILVVVGIGFFIVWQTLQKLTAPKEPDQAMTLLQNQMNELKRALEMGLSDTNRSVQTQLQTQLGSSAKLIQDVTEKLTRLDETNKQVISITDQLKNLQDILKNPKQRGILGEYYLETVLKNVLPPGQYQMQYPFKDGTIVDAVVFVDDKVIPIDSKFSLENYNRLVEEKDAPERERLEKAFKADLKNRIDETAKYIKPGENTMDFAFMFIPHEAIYYDLLVSQVVGAVKANTQDLIEYAFKQKHVIIVSPTSFLAYLQTVLQGLNALKIEKDAEEIRKKVQLLGKHLISYEEYMRKLGVHLSTTVNMYNAASKEFKKVDKDVLKITVGGGDIEPMTLAGPRNEDE
jgi:DNA recombination protein RmuC